MLIKLLKCAKLTFMSKQLCCDQTPLSPSLLSARAEPSRALCPHVPLHASAAAAVAVAIAVAVAVAVAVSFPSCSRGHVQDTNCIHMHIHTYIHK